MVSLRSWAEGHTELWQLSPCPSPGRFLGWVFFSLASLPQSLRLPCWVLLPNTEFLMTGWRAIDEENGNTLNSSLFNLKTEISLNNRVGRYRKILWGSVCSSTEEVKIIWAEGKRGESHKEMFTSLPNLCPLWVLPLTWLYLVLGFFGVCVDNFYFF